MKVELDGKYKCDGIYVTIKGHIVITDKNSGVIKVQDCDLNFTLEEFLDMVIKKTG